MDFDAAAARAAFLLRRAERCRRCAEAAADHGTAQRLLARARQLEADAAVEMAHAALLRHSTPEDDSAEHAALPGAAETAGS